MITKFLKPAEGLLVRDPVLKDRLPPDGRLVEMSGYWTRRLIDGDVTETKPPEPSSPPAEEKAAGEVQPPATEH